jgi:hypothetical protein
MNAATAFEIDDIVQAIAARLPDFQTLGRFTRVSRRFRAVIDERRVQIYAVHTEVTRGKGNKYRGTTYTYVYGVLHSVQDKPAMENRARVLRWYRNGLLHRNNDKPADVWRDGSRYWYQRGLLHRDGDRPAEIWADGTQRWYQRGKRHREDGQPAEMYADGAMCWSWRGKLHRDGDLPAIVTARGSQLWFLNGERRRPGTTARPTLWANGEYEWRRPVYATNYD